MRYLYVYISIKCRLVTHDKCKANDIIAKPTGHGDNMYMSHLSSKPNGTYKEISMKCGEYTQAVRLSAANIRTYVRDIHSYRVAGSPFN